MKNEKVIYKNIHSLIGFAVFLCILVLSFSWVSPELSSGIFFTDSQYIAGAITSLIIAFYPVISSKKNQLTGDYNRFLPITSNIKDFIELLSPLHIQKKKSGLRILIYNWRDRKHVWAGGAEVYIDELSKQWVKGENTVVMFCGNDGRSARDETIDGIRIIRRGGFFTVYLWGMLYFIFKFRGCFDLIIDSENGIPFFTPLFSRKPVLLLIHHVHQEIFIEHLKFPLSYIARFIEGNIMPFIYRNKTVITVSESSKKEIVKAGIANEDRIQIINPGITPVVTHYQKTDYPTIIYLGRLKAYKNIDIAIRAFYQLKKKIKRARFWIVGEGDSFTELRDLTIKLGLEKSIFFHGKVSDEEKIRLLSQSWVAVQPSQVEGWGITVIEANACQTPVVASNTNGLKDSVIDHKTGLLVRIRDTKEFAKALSKIIKNNMFRESISKEAFLWSKKFHWEASAGKFMTIAYHDITIQKHVFSWSKLPYINRLTSLF